MGGDNPFSYPRKVWSPAGGHWHYPVLWKRNTAILGIGLGCVAACIAIVSEKKAVYYNGNMDYPVDTTSSSK